MKAKDVHELFDSSVRKLKKVYGTEARWVWPVYLSLTDQRSAEYENKMAMCKTSMDWDLLQLGARLMIFPRPYLRWCNAYRLTDEEIRFSVMNTACHEMAHYLDMAREVNRLRNEYAHIDKKFAERFIDCHLRLVDKEPHGEAWKDIMDEMGAFSDSRWKPSYEMPKIFVR